MSVPGDVRSGAMPATPPMPSYLMSVLSRQLALGPSAFLLRYPNSWLVWETGTWGVPSIDDQLSVAQTRLAETRPPRAPAGDALCFALRAPEGTPVRLGRGVDNEIVIADPTVSRFHARLDRVDGVWSVTPVNDPALVGEDVVTPGATKPLQPGEAIELGGVRLAYYDSRTFKDRVSTVPLRPSR